MRALQVVVGSHQTVLILLILWLTNYLLYLTPFDALEPHIDAKTMEIHHDKHHQAYITNANNALKDYPDLAAKPVEDSDCRFERRPGSNPCCCPKQRRRTRESFLLLENPWSKCRGAPTGKLAEAIDSTFGGLRTSSKRNFRRPALARFGSGWAWLVVNKTGKLEIVSTANQDSPIIDGLKPVLGVDVWEHAYYLKYQNRRPDYLKAIWAVINWDAVGKNYDAAV